MRLDFVFRNDPEPLCIDNVLKWRSIGSTAKRCRPVEPLLKPLVSSRHVTALLQLAQPPRLLLKALHVDINMVLRK